MRISDWSSDVCSSDLLTSASIDFVSDQYKGGVPSIAFNGVDLSDVGSYVVDRFQDNQGGSKNKEFAAQADLTLQLSDAHLLRNLQVGFRSHRRLTSRHYGYSDGFPRLGGRGTAPPSFPVGRHPNLNQPTNRGNCSNC